MIPFCETFKKSLIWGRWLFNEHLALKSRAGMKKEWGIAGVWMGRRRKAAPESGRKREITELRDSSASCLLTLSISAPLLCLRILLWWETSGQQSNRGVPICCPSPPSISLSLSPPLFTLHNSLSPISFTSTQPIALFCPAEVSSSLSFSLPPSSPLFHFVLHLSISYFPFFLNLPFSLLFFCLVPGPHPGYQLRPLQPYLLSSVPSFGSFFQWEMERQGERGGMAKNGEEANESKITFPFGDTKCPC